MVDPDCEYLRTVVHEYGCGGSTLESRCKCDVGDERMLCESHPYLDARFCCYRYLGGRESGADI
jgi:hypothetical protein